MAEDLHRLFRALGNRFEDVRLLGEGGMARVYSARDLRLQRQVAIKVFSPVIGSAVPHNRFYDEIRITARLQHPNIVPVFDSGMVDGFLFYLMPLIEGVSLQDKLSRDGPLPLSETLRITDDVAGALAYAHEQGVIHRDVKPGNILLGGSAAMILDFGIARAMQEAGGKKLTRTGISIGTPIYMSPEQCTGEVSIDGRSDQYSLACVVFEMLTGEPPFGGSSGRVVMARHVQERPPSVEVVRPDLPPSVGDALSIAMAKSPADRFPSLREFSDAVAGRTPTPKVGWKIDVQPAKSQKIRGAVAAILSVILIGFVASQIIGRRPLDPNRILVLPLEDSGPPEAWKIGDDVVANIGYILDGTDPLRWVEGREVVNPGQDPAQLSHRESARLAQRSGAALFMNGSILRTSDSVTVVLRLYDTRSRDLVRRAGRSGTPTQGAELSLGAEAAKELISAIIEPGRPVDVAAISLRSGAALTRFHLGEVSYRNAQFGEALHHYQSTLAEDSTFALAAVRGAQAASWIEKNEVAEWLSGLAVQRDSLLPPKFREFAWGIRFHQMGMTDSAMVRYRAALELDPQWVEALVAMGEVYYHRVFRGREADSTAAEYFRQVRTLDPGFHLPAYHLAEMAVRQGAIRDAEELIGELEELDPDPVLELQLSLMLECARSGPDGIDWSTLAQRDSIGSASVLAAAQSLSAGGGYLDCSEAGARAAFQWPQTPVQRWGAFLLLQYIYLIRGEPEALHELVDSAVMHGLPGSRLYLLDVAVDHGYAEEAAEQAGLLLESGAEGIPSSNLWLLGTWAESRRDRGLLSEFSSVLEERARRTGDSRDQVISLIMQAKLALLEEQADRAFEVIRGLRPSVTASDLMWNPWEAMAGEKLGLAEIHLERGEHDEFNALTSEMDSHRAVVNLAYLPRSLEMRARASEAMGDSAAAEVYRNRLLRLRAGATN